MSRRLLFLALALAAACSRESAPRADSLAVAKPRPHVSLLGGGPYVYVSGEDGNAIAVIDTRADTVVASVQPGRRPRGLRVSPDGSTLIVAVSGSPKSGPGVDESKLPPADRSRDGIALGDLARRALKRTLPGGIDPESFDVSADGKTIYVSNEDGGTVTILDVVSGTAVAAVTVGGEPEGVTISPDGSVVYVTSEGTGTVSVISTATRKVITTIKVGKRPRSVAFTRDGAKAYVTNEVGASVSVVDAKRHKVRKTISLAGENVKPMGSALSPDGARVYITTGRGGTLVAIDTKTDSVVASVSVGKRPWGVGVSADGARIYTANGPSNDVTVVDAATFTVLRRVPAGTMPWGIAVAK